MFNQNGAGASDNLKYKMGSRFVFFTEEFEKIKLGYPKELGKDSGWYIACKDDCVHILLSRDSSIVFKTEFVNIKNYGYYVSCTSRSKFEIESKNYSDTIFKQNYRNFWIFGIITELILKNPPLLPLDRLVREAKIDFNGIHGFSHWRSVYRFGKMLYPQIDDSVLFYFSVFHDFFRNNDNTDNNHGKYALSAIPLIKMTLKKWNGDMKLHPLQIEQLAFALEYHDCLPDEYLALNNPLKDDKTVRICIDADRLDLERVGICPDSRYLLTTEARRYNDNREL